VRRAKLYYLRELRGKAAKIRERRGAEDLEAVYSAPAPVEETVVEPAVVEEQVSETPVAVEAVVEETTTDSAATDSATADEAKS
jgi:hypothetical protein